MNSRVLLMKNINNNINILKTKGLTKRFPGVLAVDHVDFELSKGEIHGLVGENGAGKSTFVKMLNGSYHPDEGEIIINDKLIQMKSPQDAVKRGIGMVHQELMLLPHLNVAENICISWLILNNKKRIYWKELYNIADNQLKKLGVHYNLTEIVSKMSIAQQQIISIARALTSNCNILILDEPTSALPQEDVDNLFSVLNKLKKQNVSSIFISHRLREVLEIADRVTVLRDSKKVGTFHIGSLSETKIAELIVGKPVKNKFPKLLNNKIRNQVILRTENLKLGDKLDDISIVVKKSEVLGIIGALGAGKTELALTLFGAYRNSPEGDIIFEGKKIKISSPDDAINKGIALIPEDRRGLGLILNQGVRFNISLPILRVINRLLFVKREEERNITRDFIKKLNIKCTSMEQITENLSGGNQQKIVLAKWLAAQAKLVIMDEPTRGIDIGAKVEIYNLINELCQKGIGVILLSSEVQEVCGMSDQIIVLYRGKIVKKVAYKDANEFEIQRLVLSGR
jgi:ABC-type sugar transport system ATPase subunit